VVRSGYNPAVPKNDRIAVVFDTVNVREERVMSDVVAVEGQSAEPGLSQVERVVDTFVAPKKTFTDILRNTSWWLPFLLLVLVTLGSTAVVEKQVGWERVSENQIQQNPKQEEAMANLTPEQRASQLRLSAKITRYISWGSFVLILVFVAIFALIYWGSFNFGLGAKTTFGQMFAVCMYASLPRLLIGLLSIVTLLFGNSADAYDIRNPVGTNLAYYLTDSGPALKTALSFFDLLGLWQLALLILGTAIVAKVSTGKAAAVVVGWWILGLIISVGIAAATS
jgi:Yip1 domain